MIFIANINVSTLPIIKVSMLSSDLTFFQIIKVSMLLTRGVSLYIFVQIDTKMEISNYTRGCKVGRNRTYCEHSIIWDISSFLMKVFLQWNGDDDFIGKQLQHRFTKRLLMLATINRIPELMGFLKNGGLRSRNKELTASRTGCEWSKKAAILR